MARVTGARWGAIAMMVVASALGVARAGAQDCAGDCDDGTTSVVEIGDLITAIDIALGRLPLDACTNVDVDGDGRVDVADIIAAVVNALEGCAPPPPAGCGNGRLAAEEQCDDGNNVSGDGCDRVCVLEGPGPIDQAWHDVQPPGCGSTSGALNIAAGAPIGQEFVPSVPVLSGLAVALNSSTGQPSAGATLTASILLGSIDGTAVGSATVTLDDPGRSFWYRIDFDPPLEVSPGERYVIALDSPGRRFLWRHFQPTGEACAGMGYDGGVAIMLGEPEPQTDFLFQTYGPPAP